MANPRLAFRVHPAVDEALTEVAGELAVSVSELLRHGVFLVLEGIDRYPQIPHYNEKSRSPLKKVNKVLPVVTNWPEQLDADAVNQSNFDARSW